MEQRIEKRMRILEGRMSGVSELAAEHARMHHATAVQVQNIEGSMVELALVLAVAEINEEFERLYEQSFRALVEERLSPNGLWYTEQEFHRHFMDAGRTWCECSRAKRGRPLEEWQ